MTERVWTIRDALGWTTDYFTRKQVPEPRRSSEWLLSAATGLSRVELYAFHDRPLSPEERARFREGIERRAAGEPLQYVTGEMPFRHLVLRVRPGVFIPRPETEVLVDVALAALPAGHETIAIDLCTGSGAVAVSLALENPWAVVYASDLNPLAVETTWDNAARAGVGGRVNVFEGDLFSPLPEELKGRVPLIAANPPYIPSADIPTLPAEVLGFEPRLALDGGHDGLETARHIVAEAPEWLAPGGMLAMELDETRVAGMAREMEAARWRDVSVTRDLTGRERVVSGRRPG
ncbi:MAG TPA: peptide chain release factor N(5)-glutamine methyltransferase [Coriobacteriia bacterium]